MDYLKRYELRPLKDQPFEWATVVIGSDGYFSAVSDYGSYAFRWTHHGCNDFREFVIRLERDPHYALSKLSPQGSDGHIFSEDKTVRYVRGQVCRLRREGRIDRETARTEWEIIEDCLRSWGGQAGLRDWMETTELDPYLDTWDVSQSVPEPSLWAFCTRILPRLAELVRAELESEKTSVGPEKDACRA